MLQLSVFLENRTGALTEATGLLAAHDVDIQAFSVSDTEDFGVMHLIVDEPERAAQALKEGGYVVYLDDVLAVEADNRPGAFHRTLQRLSAAGVGVEYSYAFVSPKAGKAQFIIKTTDRKAADKALAEE